MSAVPESIRGAGTWRRSGAWVCLAALSLAVGCTRDDASAGVVDTLQAQVPTPTASIDQSRVNAIVRAAERVAPAVVSVHVMRRETGRSSFFDPFFSRSRVVSGLGSGFFYEGGRIITNAHVVEGAERLRVTLSDGRDVDAELLGVDPLTDIAVLEAAEGADLPVAPLGSSEGLLIGEWAVAIGNPFGRLLSNPEPTVTAGVISALGRHIVPDADDRGFYLGMIQTDASINPGNSGGPLVNALGEVIGVNTSIFSRSGGSEGLGFAIPIDRAVRVARDLADEGQVARAWLGLGVQAVEADEWGRTRGVEIRSVAGGSPAAQAGLIAGRRILTAHGRPMTGPLDYQGVLLDLRAGEPVTFEIEGSPAPITVAAAPLPTVTADRVESIGGLVFVTVSPAIRAERGLASEEGALVLSAPPGIANQMGLAPGDVLRQVNRAVIRNADEAAAALEAVARAGGRVRLVHERGGGLYTRDFFLRR